MTEDEIRQRFEDAFPSAKVEIYDYWPNELPHSLGVCCAFPYVVVNRDYLDTPMKKQSKQEFARDNLKHSMLWRKAVRLDADKPDIDSAITEIIEAIPVVHEQFGVRIVC